MSIKNFVRANLNPFLSGKGDPAWLSPVPYAPVGDKESQIYCLRGSYTMYFSADISEVWIAMYRPTVGFQLCALVIGWTDGYVPEDGAGVVSTLQDFEDNHLMSGHVCAVPFKGVGLGGFTTDHVYDVNTNAYVLPSISINHDDTPFRRRMLAQGLRIRPLFNESGFNALGRGFICDLTTSTAGYHLCPVDRSGVAHLFNTASSVGFQKFMDDCDNSSFFSIPSRGSDFVLRAPLMDDFFDGYNGHLLDYGNYAALKPEKAGPLVCCKLTFTSPVSAVHFDSVTTLQYNATADALSVFSSRSSPITVSSPIFSALSHGPILRVE